MWVGWPVERVLLLFLGVVFLALFVQVTMMHSRQNFRHWAMWLPVLGTPTLGVLSLIMVFWNAAALRTIFSYLLVIVGVAGVMGTFFHLEGVGERVDGYTLSNFLVGPPVLLPIMVTAMSVLGLIILFLVR